MRPKRFVIEGEWSGYTRSQQKVAHRQVYEGGRKKLRAWAEQIYSLPFSDGTSLVITVRDCLPRERVDEIRGYTKFIEDAFYNSMR